MKHPRNAVQLDRPVVCVEHVHRRVGARPHSGGLDPDAHSAPAEPHAQLERFPAGRQHRIDLDDIGENTGRGLHLAAMGSVWRALAFGFAGLRPIGDALAIDPILAPGWEALELHVRFRGSRVRVRIEPTGVRASADPPVNALDANNRPIQLSPVPRMLHSASTRRSSR